MFLVAGFEQLVKKLGERLSDLLEWDGGGGVNVRMKRWNCCLASKSFLTVRSNSYAKELQIDLG